MDVTELFWVDDLLDLSNDELFSPNSTTTTSSATATTITTTDHPFSDNAFSAATIPYFSSTDFTDHLSIPSDDVAELEWLSNFVDDSFTDFSGNFFAGTVNLRRETATYGRSRSKRFRSTTSTGWTSSGESHAQLTGKSKTNSNINNTTRIREGSVSTNRDRASSAEDLSRRCTHCSSEKTPQWRTGPLGPKTLCNACGVRYKSGRLVPEYRPAASPTFVLSQHSNSHRKVLELCRQKELLRQHQHQ